MTREKDHKQALENIAEQATNENRVPAVAFAAFIYEEQIDFTHSTEGDVQLRTVLDGLATHTAALSEATGHSVEEILSVTLDMALEKRAGGHGEWGGP